MYDGNIHTIVLLWLFFFFVNVKLLLKLFWLHLMVLFLLFLHMLQLVPTITLYTDKNIIRTKVNKVRKKIKAAVFLIGHFGIGKPMKTLDTQVVHVVLKEVNMLFPNIFQF